MQPSNITTRLHVQRQALLLTHTCAYGRACRCTYVHGGGICTRPLDRMIQSMIQNLTTVQSNILACSAEVLHRGNVAFSRSCEHLSCRRYRPMVMLLALWPLLLLLLPTTATAAFACWPVQCQIFRPAAAAGIKDTALASIPRMCQQQAWVQQDN